ncbi:LysR family transcriptional regulator [Donghicola mangrovi]|uniref:LysR family transcriptional regulator n=1 Tax=Donghicola mangrovi TaxID=2729614 RepID=A0A850Q748_9RHOB|nr:LysR family transcriptional regulator [Donghicola mangrovi]NVO24946.1 LysR family transcriptional regulator [Donghicola mangrovi]
MTKPIDPMAVDFRALQVLVRVYRLQSFTRAAEDLEVNQSVVSYTIEKLRGVFNDPLFVREARSLITTPRCEEVVTEALDMLARFDHLASARAFDPARTAGTITIACNYYERVIIIPDVVHAIRAQAPNLKIEIVDSSYLGHDRLLRMEADLLIGPFEQLGASFYGRKLYDDRYVCMMDPAHPRAGQDLSLQDYLPLDHVYITYGGKWKSRYMAELDRLGYDLPVAIRVPSPAGIQNLIEGTHLIATIPERLSRKIGSGLHITACPVPTHIDIQLVWTARTHNAPMHKWVRELVFQQCRMITNQWD